MDITEQKAKAYEISLEKARKIYKSEYRDVKESLEYIFPEITESDDEVIRKKLIDYFSTGVNYDWAGIDNWKVLSWLEKQGENRVAKKNQKEIRIIDDDTLNKLDDDAIIMWLARLISTGFYTELPNDPMPCKRLELIDWLKMLKERIKSKKDEEFGYDIETEGLPNFPEKEKEQTVTTQKEIEGSKSKEKNQSEIQHFISRVIRVLKEKAYLNFLGEKVNPYDKEIEWLNSLKWKKSLATADLEKRLCDLQDNYRDTSYEYRVLCKAIEYIRCTEPKQWKPNKEQMSALRRAVHDTNYYDYRRDLVSLKTELEKLKK